LQRLRITDMGHDADFGILNRINRLFSVSLDYPEVEREREYYYY